MALDFPDSPFDGETYEGFQWSASDGVWRITKPTVSNLFSFQYLVIGGGGGGGGYINGGGFGSGGGAGGYRCSVPGELSGGNSQAEPVARLAIGQVFGVSVGPGGAGSSAAGSPGIASVFNDIVAIGGGGGAGRSRSIAGTTGGSGGGGGYNAVNNQGFAGQNVTVGGGGGAGEAGGTDGNGQGGDGISSSITGTAVTRAGGGGAYGAIGGDGGGGGNPTAVTATAGTANTGGGGGGGGQNGSPDPRSGGAGGSGVVILKYPDTLTLNIGPRLTSTTTSAGGFKVTTFTAGDDLVTVS